MSEIDTPKNHSEFHLHLVHRPCAASLTQVCDSEATHEEMVGHWNLRSSLVCEYRYLHGVGQREQNPWGPASCGIRLLRDTAPSSLWKSVGVFISAS
jgi:hypothetical protein